MQCGDRNFNSIQFNIIYCTKNTNLNIQPTIQFRITILINKGIESTNKDIHINCLVVYLGTKAKRGKL